MNINYLIRFSLLLAVVTLGAQAENWPCFRGPTRQGVSLETNLPLEWSATRNVLWRTPIPGQSWASPIVWEGSVFVVTTTDDGVSCRVIAIDRETGKITWDREAFKQTAGHKNDRNSNATPTPCTDGERVYAVFGDGSFAALDFAGRTMWVNRDFPFYGEHGLGTSPILWEDLLIMARDGSHPPPDTSPGWHEPWDQAFLIALDKRSGKLRWKASRGRSRIAHVVPSIWNAPGGSTQVISGAGDVVQGFDARSGELVWTSRNIGEGVVPSIVLGDGLAYTASGWGGRESIKAFRLDGKGDLGESNLVWEQRKAMPHIPSFLYLAPYLFTITEGGIAMCLQGETGEVVWQERLSGSFSASPVAAEGHVYLLSDAGETTVIDGGPQFRIVARNSLPEKTQASIAISHGQLFIRSVNNLFCIGNGRGVK
jgi:outer membrane protein assembly factor BamB